MRSDSKQPIDGAVLVGGVCVCIGTAMRTVSAGAFSMRSAGVDCFYKHTLQCSI